MELAPHFPGFLFPNKLFKVIAAANGAVTADVNPAAKSPNPSKYFPEMPILPCNATESSSNEKAEITVVPTIKTAMENIPPKITDVAKPNRISLTDCF